MSNECRVSGDEVRHYSALEKYAEYVRHAIWAGLIVDHGEHALYRYSLMTFDQWLANRGGSSE